MNQVSALFVYPNLGYKMPRFIIDDWMQFRGRIAGMIEEYLKKFVNSSKFVAKKGDGKFVTITVPTLEIPHIVYGSTDDGVGRGPGKEGEVIHKDDGEGEGGQPGEGTGPGIDVKIPLEELLRLIKEELELPDMKPKPNQTYEETRTIYRDISKNGPRSLLHKRRMMRNAMKRVASWGDLNKTKLLPGHAVPVKVLAPINDDMVYRQYEEIKVPSSNAVIFFIRDYSGSMDNYKCDLAMDVSWWVDLYIRQYFDKTERVYILHDGEAKEVGEQEFYSNRDGGGTYATSALKLMENVVESRYNPIKWNIYGLYFGDGETFGDDNTEFVKMLRGPLGKDVVNMFAQVELLAYDFAGWGGQFGGLKGFIDKSIAEGGLDHVRNTEIKRDKKAQIFSDQDFRNSEVKRVIVDVLGKDRSKATKEAV